MRPVVAAAALAVAFAAASSAQAQWAKRVDASFPRTADGEPDLSAPAPKTADEKPDLSGVWIPDIDPTMNIVSVEHIPFPKYFISIAADMKPEDVPFQPWAADLFRQRTEGSPAEIPVAHCKPTGVPWINSVPLPYKIVQTPSLVLILYEENTVFRQIFLDGRRPVENPVPRWMGYSTGRWEGDTLVVETVGFNDRHWLDGMGHPNSSELRVIERFRRPNAGHLEIEITIDDPAAYTRPITYKPTLTLLPEDDLLEYFCTENEKSSEHYR
ncbi:MAG TPA: hypothetical protein VF329_03725 [Gammaproteobacteria bacterium]